MSRAGASPIEPPASHALTNEGAGGPAARPRWRAAASGTTASLPSATGRPPAPAARHAWTDWLTDRYKQTLSPSARARCRGGRGGGVRTNLIKMKMRPNVHTSRRLGDPPGPREQSRGRGRSGVLVFREELGRRSQKRENSILTVPPLSRIITRLRIVPYIHDILSLKRDAQPRGVFQIK